MRIKRIKASTQLLDEARPKDHEHKREVISSKEKEPSKIIKEGEKSRQSSIHKI